MATGVDIAGFPPLACILGGIKFDAKEVALCPGLDWSRRHTKIALQLQENAGLF